MKEIIEIKMTVKPTYAQATLNTTMIHNNLRAAPPACTTSQQKSQLKEEKEKDKARIEQAKKDI